MQWRATACSACCGPRLHDTFVGDGVGWGGTWHNKFPVLRIDQVWVSRHFKVVAATARRTQHSDHRMVLAGVRLVP